MTDAPVPGPPNRPAPALERIPKDLWDRLRGRVGAPRTRPAEPPEEYLQARIVEATPPPPPNPVTGTTPGHEERSRG